MGEFRYDPVWRRIRQDSFSHKLEGRFPDRFARLDQLVNWGALSWIHPHATATKQAHHLGVEHNAMRFLAHGERLDHRPALRAAAHILHWGHPPLSYQGAEALLRGAHAEPKVQRVLQHVVDEVVAFGALDCAQEDHGGRCARALLAGERPFELYRWFSAWIAAENWDRLFQAIRAAEVAEAGAEPDEEKLKQEIIATLVCHEDRGFKVLTKCNIADFVPRDLLQSGTAWLTLDPDVLWDRDPIGPSAVDEWALIDSSASYLEQRFYGTPHAVLLHSLVARVIANSIAGKPFLTADLRSLLEAKDGDNHLPAYLGQYHSKRYQALHERAAVAFESDWHVVGSFEGVSVPNGSRFDAEDFLSGRTGRRRVSYPLTDDYCVLVDFLDQPPFRRHMAGEGRQYGQVNLYHRPRANEFSLRPVLDVLAKVDDWIEPQDVHQVGDALLSSLLNCKVEQRTHDLSRVCTELVAVEGDYLRPRVRELRKKPSLHQLNDHQAMVFQADFLSDPDFSNQFPGAAQFYLHLPWRAVTLKAGREILKRIRDAAIVRASNSADARKGEALELAVAMDQLLAPGDVSHRLIALNVTALTNRNPTREWDVVRIDLLKNGDWCVTASECAVSLTSKKENLSRERLQVLQKALMKTYTDLSYFRPYFVSVVNGKLAYSDAGCSYNRSVSGA